MSEKNGEDRVWEALRSASNCMLATHDAGALRARPLALYTRDGDKVVYFLTDARSHKEDEIRADPRVCLTLSEDDFFLSLSGTAVVSRDQSIINDLWDIGAAAWFDGKDDPNLRLLTVYPEFAEYWDRPGTIAAAVKITFAAIAGHRPDMGDNRKVSM